MRQQHNLFGKNQLTYRKGSIIRERSNPDFIINVHHFEGF